MPALFAFRLPSSAALDPAPRYSTSPPPHAATLRPSRVQPPLSHGQGARPFWLPVFSEGFARASFAAIFRLFRPKLPPLPFTHLTPPPPLSPRPPPCPPMLAAPMMREFACVCVRRRVREVSTADLGRECQVKNIYPIELLSSSL